MLFFMVNHHWVFYYTPSNYYSSQALAHPLLIDVVMCLFTETNISSTLIFEIETKLIDTTHNSMQIAMWK